MITIAIHLSCVPIHSMWPLRLTLMVELCDSSTHPLTSTMWMLLYKANYKAFVTACTWEDVGEYPVDSSALVWCSSGL